MNPQHVKESDIPLTLPKRKKKKQKEKKRKQKLSSQSGNPLSREKDKDKADVELPERTANKAVGKPTTLTGNHKQIVVIAGDSLAGKECGWTIYEQI